MLRVSLLEDEKILRKMAQSSQPSQCADHQQLVAVNEKIHALPLDLLRSHSKPKSGLETLCTASVHYSGIKLNCSSFCFDYYLKQEPNLQFSSVAQSCPTLCDPINRSTPGLSVHHQLSEFTQTHVHRVSDAIQPSHPLSSPSPPAPNPSQHQSFPMSQLFV